MEKKNDLGTTVGLCALAALLIFYTVWIVQETKAWAPVPLLFASLIFLLPTTRRRSRWLRPGLGLSAGLTLAVLLAMASLGGEKKLRVREAAEQKQQQDAATRAAAVRAERLADYEKNKLQILRTIEDQLEAGQAREASATVNRYLAVTKDPDLGRLQHRAAVGAMRQDLAEREASLPPERLWEIYSTLSKDDVGNRGEYTEKLRKVETQLEAKKAAEERAARVAAMQANIDRQFSKWDGSHRAVEAEIKARLKDPSSYEHVKTSYSVGPDALTVYTTYRAKNSFGAVVTETRSAIVSPEGAVISLN